MKALADYVHAKGLKLGIYSSPGPKTCAGYEGSYRHEEQDAKHLRRLGHRLPQVRLVHRYARSRRTTTCSAEEALPEYARRAAQAGRDIVYSLCQYGWAKVWEWGHEGGRQLLAHHRRHQRQLAVDGRHRFRAKRHRHYAGPGHWNDPDMLVVGNGGMTPTEYLTHFSLWALIGAPLIAGNDLRNMDAATREILLNKEVIAVNQDRLGKGGYRVAKVRDAEVWAKPLDKGAWAVGLFNRGMVKAEVMVKFADLKIAGKAKVRDLWAHADLGEADSYITRLGPHQVVMLKVTR